MSELIRDTAFGHLVRLVTRGKYLQYEEEKDPSLWKRYVNEEASGHLAHHGTIEPEDKGEKGEKDSDEDDSSEQQHPIGGVRTRDEYDKMGDQGSSSSQSEKEKTRLPDDGTVNIPSGVKIDPEKGRDAVVIDWWGPNDPEVCRDPQAHRRQPLQYIDFP